LRRWCGYRVIAAFKPNRFPFRKTRTSHCDECALMQCGARGAMKFQATQIAHLECGLMCFVRSACAIDSPAMKFRYATDIE